TLPSTSTSSCDSLSLHDALPIFPAGAGGGGMSATRSVDWNDLHVEFGLDVVKQQLLAAAANEPPVRTAGLPHTPVDEAPDLPPRSEEHTSELQSRENLVCRLLLE